MNEKEDFMDSLINPKPFGDVNSSEEEAFRRGFHHGFLLARENSKITEEEVREWRYSEEMIFHPGSNIFKID